MAAAKSKAVAKNVMGNWPNRDGISLVKMRPGGGWEQRKALISYHGEPSILKCTKNAKHHNSEVDALGTLGHIFKQADNLCVPRVLDSFITKDKYHCMVLELVLGFTLREYVHVPKAIGIMHREGIIHGNINPDNIIVQPGKGKNGVTKITFVGFEPVNKRTKPGLGTHGYIPPEEYTEHKVYPYKRDAWMLGATLYFAANGTPPYGYTKKRGKLTPLKAEAMQHTMKKVAKTGKNSFQPVNTKNKALLGMITQLLNSNAANRINVEEIDWYWRDGLFFDDLPPKRPHFKKKPKKSRKKRREG
ncbi:kinase-like domain-containing protein [Thamnocephalis sphaerospora]|uniref:Kinase-like domain-containing protein n=1 Tax=Thamnocephalis sphaerospora TaxID=78915 RepID=A0A4P9XGQ8_9FUNG|nr:kinase-like domain-containing protein [Thamnocephalis sphaerospora]|eukprot:RKP04835.1 kinase-like domain-containing protein [Thamnocephalis sphaerospora]